MLVIGESLQGLHLLVVTNGVKVDLVLLFFSAVFDSAGANRDRGKSSGRAAEPGSINLPLPPIRRT